ncbi:MAG: hypothetical protein FWD14_08815 [Treponema sp.]|nr:hypothetical protein [Treponema sp.]
MKRLLLVLVIVMFAAGGVFAQAKNTITVDLGPTIIGGALGAAADLIGDDGLGSSGFGIGFQYERNIIEQLSVAGRFAYLGFGMGMKDTFQVTEEGVVVTVNTEIGIDISSFSLEAHARYYPGRTFFLDGMLGFANLTMGVNGSFAGSAEGEKVELKLSESISRQYLKYGAKLGWRIRFGNQRGFTFEPAFGFYGCAGLGKTLGTQIVNILGPEAEKFSDELDEAVSLLEKYFFIGGPRVTLAFGWSF